MLKLGFAAVLAACCVAGNAWADAQTSVSGYVNADASQQLPSALYAVTHVKTGRYRIDFTDDELLPYPVCLAQPLGTKALLTGLIANHRHCDVYFVDAGTGKPVDATFSFIAVPISH